MYLLSGCPQANAEKSLGLTVSKPSIWKANWYLQRQGESFTRNQSLKALNGQSKMRFHLRRLRTLVSLSPIPQT